MACDPFFADVPLLLHFDGVNGSTTYVDSSNYNRTMLQHFGPALMTGLYQFPPSSCSFDSGFGVGGNGVVYTDATTEMDVSTGVDFTVEFWHYFRSATGAGGVAVRLDGNENNGSVAWSILTSITGSTASFSATSNQPGGVSCFSLVTASTFSLDAEHHIALVRTGSTITLYVDGVAAATGPVTGNPMGCVGVYTIGAFPGPCAINFGGIKVFNTAFSSCALDEFRYTVGLARYTSNFTPPTQPFGGTCVVIPDVVGQTQAAASSAITGAGFTVGTVTHAHDPVVPFGYVISQNPVGGTPDAPGTPVDLVVSLGVATITVPNVVGLTHAAATTALAGAGLIVGIVTTAPSFQPVGRVTSESPVAGSIVAVGSAVNLVESNGLIPVPNVVGEQLIVAENTILAAGLTIGPITAVQLSGITPGTVNGQSPAAGTGVLPGTAVDLISVSAITNAFDVGPTVISQYANSPTLLRLIENMAAYIDPSADFLNFFSFVWNVDTAVGFGLDIWGRIVGVSRVLPISGALNDFGFHNSDSPPDWEPFNQGPFFSGNANTGAYTLPDDAYRTLILTKALANITATNAQALNQLVRNLFPGRGRCYVQDLGGMAMSYVFEFALSTVEYAILTQSGVLPHPAGVLVNVLVIPGTSFVGFIEAGAGLYQPFGYGQFYIPGE